MRMGFTFFLLIFASQVTLILPGDKSLPEIPIEKNDCTDIPNDYNGYLSIKSNTTTNVFTINGDNHTTIYKLFVRQNYSELFAERTDCNLTLSPGELIFLYKVDEVFWFQLGDNYACPDTPYFGNLTLRSKNGFYIDNVSQLQVVKNCTDRFSKLNNNPKIPGSNEHKNNADSLDTSIVIHPNSRLIISETFFGNMSVKGLNDTQDIYTFNTSNFFYKIVVHKDYSVPLPTHNCSLEISLNESCVVFKNDRGFDIKHSTKQKQCSPDKHYLGNLTLSSICGFKADIASEFKFVKNSETSWIVIPRYTSNEFENNVTGNTEKNTTEKPVLTSQYSRIVIPRNTSNEFENNVTGNTEKNTTEKPVLTSQYSRILVIVIAVVFLVVGMIIVIVYNKWRRNSDNNYEAELVTQLVN